jgi:L-lactate dehydrogenase
MNLNKLKITILSFAFICKALTFTAQRSFSIGIIGATGNVGESAAFLLQHEEVATQLVLWSRDVDKCEGCAGDLRDASTDTEIISTKDIQDVATSDIIIITAGEKQKPGGQTRDELLEVNQGIITSIIDGLHSSPKKNQDAIIVVVTNPVEDLAQCILQQAVSLGYLANPSTQIIGTGTSLDSRRLVNSLIRVCGVTRQQVENGWVFGEHGDKQFVAWSQVRINNGPITETQKLEVEQVTQQAAYKIIDTKGFTQFGVSRCLIDICRAIKQGGCLPISVYEPQNQVYLSLLSSLGPEGVTKIHNIEFNEAEEKQLQKCIKKRMQIKEMCK